MSLSQPQLPTVPVPAASLQSAVSGAAGAAGRVSLQHQIVSVNSVNNSQQQMIIVSSAAGSAAASPQLSQLAAQLSRPTLPTYSQAISQQTSPLRQRTSDSPHNSQLLTSPSSTSLTSPLSSGDQGTGALSALLADTPAADKPLPAGTVTVSSHSLLERLVSGGQVSAAGAQLTSAPSAAGHSNGAAGAGGEEITLQSLLSHPAKVQSPNKVSPLLQQLQQPVQSAAGYSGLTSPRPGVTSPRPAQSPRQLNPPPSPSRAPTPGHQISALQQQLMQPPAPRVNQSGGAVVTSHSILSAHLTAPPRNTGHNTGQQQVTVSVALASDQTNGAVTVPGNQTLQLLSGQPPVQLVSNTGQQVQLVSQPGLQVVNHHVNNTVQLVNNTATTPGTPAVQLVNQSGVQGAVQLVSNQSSGGGQQIMVNNVPMQLSLSPHVQFSVNLAQPDPGSAQSSNSIATLANGVNTPIIVSGAPQPGQYQ